MSNSSLVNVVQKSPNHSGRRTRAIDRITPHCVVGQLTASGIAGCFPAGREASCNYGIGSDGKISLIVDECNRSWCSSSNANDQRAVTIECASDRTEPYAMTDTVYRKLVDLCEDICRRNGKNRLIWISDKNTALNYNPKSNEMLLTVHRWFANKSCPGDWLFARLGSLAAEVTSRLGGSSKPVQPQKPSQKPDKSVDTVAREVIKGLWGNGSDRKSRLESAGYDYVAVQNRVNEILNSSAKPVQPPKPALKPISQVAKEVIRGDWGNGSDRKARLEKAGYDYSAVQAEVNRLMNGGGSSSSNQVDIDAIARRVIRGDFGNGGARRNRLVSMYGAVVADAVQQRVNQLLS